MKRARYGALALALTLGMGGAGEALAFGGFLKSAAKNRAKREAKRRAKREAAKATGVDIEALTSGNVTDAAKGMAKQAVAGKYSQYIGMSPDAIKEAVKAELYKQKGLSRFSPAHQRRSADRLADQKVDKIMQALNALKAVGGAGGLSGMVGGGGGGASSLQAQIELERQVAKQNLRAAGYEGGDAAVDAIADRASATAALAGQARARADAGLPPLMATGKAMMKKETRAQAMARIKAEVYGSKGITGSSSRLKKLLADKEVERQVAKLFP